MEHMNTYIVLKFFLTTNTFGGDIYNGAITLKEADEDQTSWLLEFINFKKKNKTTKSIEKTKE